MSERSTMSFSNQGHKDDGPSPLGVPSGISTSSSERRHDRQDSMSRPLLSPSVAVDLGHSLSSSQSPYPRAASLFHPSRGNLEVPPLSSSLPTQMDVHHMKERSISYDGAKSLANKSTSSSDPGTHLTGDIQAAITDPRIIVNLNDSGTVASGTLEGLVQRLITNFSEPMPIS